MQIPICASVTASVFLTLSSQSLPPSSPLLAVIKQNRTGAPNQSLGVPFDGKFKATNVSVAELIGAAYGGYLPLDPQHITGLPPWATRDRFDVDLRDDAAEPTEDREDDSAIFAAFAMVRTMLGERFGLKTHFTTRPEPVYALVKARTPALKPTARDCDLIASRGPFAEPPAGAAPELWRPCGLQVWRDQITGNGATLEQLAQRLREIAGVDRQVVDRTGDTGRFDFVLRWTPFLPRGADAPITDSGPSIFTALQEQLGLRLQSDRGAVRVLVVDRITRPTPN
jgi:uncharacterized protein (TIGR03435 family)